jgi:hypothetical protein
VAEEFLVVFALYSHVTQLDFTGPHEVLARLPGARCILASSTGGDLEADGGLVFTRVRRLAEIERCALVCVPGGFGTIEAMEDQAECPGEARRQRPARRSRRRCDGRAPQARRSAGGKVPRVDGEGQIHIVPIVTTGDATKNGRGFNGPPSGTSRRWRSSSTSEPRTYGNCIASIAICAGTRTRLCRQRLASRGCSRRSPPTRPGSFGVSVAKTGSNTRPFRR